VAIESAALPRLILIVPLLLSASFATGCKSREPDLAAYTEEEAASPPRPAAGIQVADPRAAPQLVSGWWDVEDHAWRWTARKFAVVLRAPIGAARRGATLRFSFTLPDVVFNRFKSVTLLASVEGTPLAPETYRRPGAALYTREIPAHFLSGPAVRIDFGLDNAFSPGNGDPRELGVIAHRLGLESQ
jgi:hypothetical protein